MATRKKATVKSAKKKKAPARKKTVKKKKKTTASRTRETPVPATVRPAAPSRDDDKVRIRMYRLGVGDCFLVRLPKTDGGVFTMLIDCGVHTSQSGGSIQIRKVAADLQAQTGGHFDVVVGTHEHYDHLSGFLLASEAFEQMRSDEIWCAWTENGDDPTSRQLRAKKRKAMAVVAKAQARAMMGAASDSVNKLTSMLGFFGDGSGARLTAAAKVLKGMSNTIRYREPGEPPIELPGMQARIFVLGPPRDLKLIHKPDSKSETYPFGAYAAAAEALDFAFDATLPFEPLYGMPLSASKAETFFQEYYWNPTAAGKAREREDLSQNWRRIDNDWLDSASSMALALDDDTNNTSLVMALELGPPDKDGPVILFAADAQVGNWLSWQDVKWPDYHGRKISGPDLLRRTMIYKVGHHASQNATLKALGLDLMQALELALVTTDAAMATKVGWGTLPWPGLLKALATKTGNKVIRTDKPAPTALGRFSLTQDPLFYEIAFSPNAGAS